MPDSTNELYEIDFTPKEKEIASSKHCKMERKDSPKSR